jgi:hypothetical protein
MARCTVTYSTELARAAIRAYYWARIKSAVGVAYIGCCVLAAVFIWFLLSEGYPVWIVSIIGLLYAAYWVIQLGYLLWWPKAYAKRLADPTKRTAEIETSAGGVRILFGGNARILEWKTYKHIWSYSDFVILSISPALMAFAFIPTNGMTEEVRRDLEGASKRTVIA